MCRPRKSVWQNRQRDVVVGVRVLWSCGRLARAVHSLYERCQACVRVLGQTSDWFGVEQGVRQGYVMSLWLFNLYMNNNIVREAVEKFVGGVQLEETVVQLLLFADDLMLVAEENEDVKM